MDSAAPHRMPASRSVLDEFPVDVQRSWCFGQDKPFSDPTIGPLDHTELLGAANSGLEGNGFEPLRTQSGRLPR